MFYGERSMIFLEIIVHEDLKIVGHGDLETMVTKT